MSDRRQHGGAARHEAPSRQLARRIGLDIVALDSPTGHFLGSQRALADRYHVSLPTLGQALRILEDDGIVATRAGRGGGVIVTSPPAEVALRAMHLHLGGLRSEPAQVDEARDAVQTAIAHIACERLDQRDLDAFARAAAMEPGADAVAAIDAAVTAAARSPILTLFEQALSSCYPPADAAELADQLALRLALIRAVTGAERDRAAALLRVSRPTGVRPPASPPRPRRRAEQLAGEIADWIRSERVAAGTRLGNEGQVGTRFAASRLATRGALRLLERIGLIDAVPGRSGGIFVGNAAADGAVSTVALYLSATRSPFGEQIRVRGALEGFAVRLAAARITPPQAADLQSALDAESSAAGYHAWVVLGTHVERLIVAACNNPVLEFLVRILIELSLYQAGWKGVAVSEGALMHDVILSHRAIAGQVLAGYPEGALRQLLLMAGMLGRVVPDA